MGETVRQPQEQNAREQGDRLERQSFERASETVRTASHGSGGRLIAIVSLIALIFSAISLYETVLKQARLTLHVPDTMGLARDPSGFEVFVVPLTIGNHGARDGAVTGLRLTVEEPATGQQAVYAAAYTGTSPAQAKRFFAPPVVAGRGSYSSVILFYPAGADRPRTVSGPLVKAKGTYRLHLSARTDITNDYGWLDQLLRAPPPTLTFEATLPWFSNPDLRDGRTIPMVVTDVDHGGTQQN